MNNLIPIIISSTIAGFFSVAGLVVSILLKAKVEAYKKEVDGLKTELVAAVKGRGEAEGNIQGRLEQTQERKISSDKEVKAESIVVTTDNAAVNAANVVVNKEADKKQ